MSADEINWRNMPTKPGPQYPALLRQIAKGYKAIREEKIVGMNLETGIYAALDELRFGVQQLVGEDIPDFQRAVTRA